MNILVPDEWLGTYLKTDATPKQLKQYLSLCGPSIERIHTIKGEIIYDIEITGNRPDAMSVVGVAREASVILPRFGIKATLVEDPYKNTYKPLPIVKKSLPLHITSDSQLNPRWTSIIFDDVSMKPSPTWLKKRLELVGVRTLNNVIDITNYLMHAYGQPAHVFDYDRIADATMTLRPSKKGEVIVTLDGKSHTLPGGDIVIEDGSHTLIDLAGIMGGENSSISDKTKRVILFIQTYNPVQIRKTVMSLSHRTEAASLFEKGLDTELVLPVFYEGVKLMQDITNGKVASNITDIYPAPYTKPVIHTKRTLVDSYIGTHVGNADIEQILSSLGFDVSVTANEIVATPPSYRRDVIQDVDIIEELSRIFGYHNIHGVLPQTEPPMVFEDPILSFEQKIKQTLANWGYTETYTYSMISEELMKIFQLPKEKTYTIANPLSSDWIYMRSTLLPSMLLAMKQNLSFETDLKLFELSMTYAYRDHDLPLEQSTLIVALSGKRYGKLKGIAEALFSLSGIPFPNGTEPASTYYIQSHSLRLGNFGQIGEIHPALLQNLGVPKPITVLELSVEQLFKHRNITTKYKVIPKYPASYEDLAFVVPDMSYVGSMVEYIKTIHPLITDVSLFDSFKNIRTFHITYQSDIKNLTANDISTVRTSIISGMKKKFHATLKTL